METKRLILKKFSDYYRTAKITVPAIAQREFGVGGFAKKIESRHIAFQNDEMLRNYLVQDTPLYISHSIAYYEFPSATPMEKKNWGGADLIFDLDVHAGIFLTPEEIEKVKGDAIALKEDFLVSDFGISPKQIRTVFSGNRGFHLHVPDQDYRGLGGDARREISDYVSATGLDYRTFFTKEEVGRGAFMISGPRETDWGYRGRFYRRVERMLRSEPQKIHRRLKKEGEMANFLSGMREGIWSRTSIKDIIERLGVVWEGMPIGSIDVDTGVTIDTKRLIRVPGTLHGSSGLCAMEVKDVEKFEPYRDAAVLGKEPMRIRALQPVAEQEFLGETMEKISKGAEAEAPASYALCLALKGAAELTP